MKRAKLTSENPIVGHFWRPLHISSSPVSLSDTCQRSDWASHHAARVGSENRVRDWICDVKFVPSHPGGLANANNEGERSGVRRNSLPLMTNGSTLLSSGTTLHPSGVPSVTSIRVSEKLPLGIAKHASSGKRRNVVGPRDPWFSLFTHLAEGSLSFASGSQNKSQPHRKKSRTPTHKHTIKLLHSHRTRKG